MRSFYLATAAALALGLGTTALTAQDTATSTTVVMTTDQQTMYQSWPVDRRSTFDVWPANYQTYFWTLTPGQQTAWWALTDEQRAQLYSMAPDQRMTTWTSIEGQMAAAPMVDAASPAAATTSGPTVMSTTMPSPPAESMNKSYPVCTRALQDSCQNAGEGGAPGRSRAVRTYRPH